MVQLPKLSLHKDGYISWSTVELPEIHESSTDSRKNVIVTDHESTGKKPLWMYTVYFENTASCTPSYSTYYITTIRNMFFSKKFVKNPMKNNIAVCAELLFSTTNVHASFFHFHFLWFFATMSPVIPLLSWLLSLLSPMLIIDTFSPQKYSKRGT